VKIVAVDRPDVAPLEAPERFRMEIVYFMTLPGDKGAPVKMEDGEYWIDLDEAKKWLDEQVLYVVSPLDAENQAEIELTEYHDAFLQWVVEHEARHVKLS
jgi:hypothetical protein